MSSMKRSMSIVNRGSQFSQPGTSGNGTYLPILEMVLFTHGDSQLFEDRLEDVPFFVL